MKYSSLKRLGAITAIISVLMPTFINASVALALDLPGIIGNAQSTSGVRLSDVLRNAGLNGNEKYADCLTGAFAKNLDSFVDGFGNRLKDAIGDFIKEMVTRLQKQLIFCAVGAIIGKVANVLQCTAGVSSDAGAVAKGIALQSLKSNLTTRCIANAMVIHTADTIADIIAQNGPDGGPAYVTSWEALAPDAAARARAQFYSKLVDADICPYMRDQVLEYFGVPRAYIDAAGSGGTGGSVDSPDDFSAQVGCTLPDGFTPEAFSNDWYGWGGFDMVTLLNQPQNSFDGVIATAKAQLSAMEHNAATAVLADATAGGGFLSSSGAADESCLKRSPDGKYCIQTAPIKAVSGALRDSRSNAEKAQWDFITGSHGSQELMRDMEANILNRVIDLASQPLHLPLEFDSGANENIKYTPPPSPPAVPGSGDPNDAQCTGGDPRCTCVMNDASSQQIAQRVIAPAMATLQASRTDLIEPGTSQITPGVNFREVLQALCTIIDPDGGTCIPHPGQDDEIVIRSQGITISFDIITASGNLRTNGGRAIAACEPGVQD